MLLLKRSVYAGAKLLLGKPALLEHFDEDVHARLKVQLDSAREQMDHIQQLFWTLTRFILADRANFLPGELAFDLVDSPGASIHQGRYHLITKRELTVPSEFLYRLFSR